MSFVVLALGAILSVGGAASIYYGAGIVQVEQGWTGVIAGTTALAAGILTISLGLVLRKLSDIATLLKTGAAAPIATIAAPADPLPQAAPPEKAAAWSVAATPPAAGLLEATEKSLVGSEAAAAPLERVLDEIIGAQGRENTASAEPAFVASKPVEAAVAAAKPAAEPRSIEDIWRLVDKALEEDDEARPPPVARAAIPPVPEAPASHEVVGLPPAEPVAATEAAMNPPVPSVLVEPAAAPPLEEPPLAATTLYEPAPEHDLPPAPPAAEAAPEPAEAPGREPAVIGRYEADGTSYVMFADGSIDATSDEGSFHFKSMADLRAFIESRD